MNIEQTVEIPPNRRLFVDVPSEVPVGRTILTYTPVSTISINRDIESAKKVWAYNQTHSNEIKEKLDKLKGSLGSSAFNGLDGVAYQRKVRDEWDK